MNFLSFLLSIHRAQQPRSGWPRVSELVGKASTIDIQISLTPPLIFTGKGQKVRNFGVVFNITRF